MVRGRGNQKKFGLRAVLGTEAGDPFLRHPQFPDPEAFERKTPFLPAHWPGVLAAKTEANCVPTSIQGYEPRYCVIAMKISQW
jgi:hypothetical protein